MPPPDPLPVLIQKVSEALSEYDRLAFDEHLPHPLGPPAAREDTARLLQQASTPLPPDYIAFLEMHDGWKNFAGEAHILSTQDHASSWTQEVIRYWTDLWIAPHPNPFALGAVPILLGTKENLFIVAEVEEQDGTLTSCLVMYDYMYEIRRFDDFASLLEHRLGLLSALIERETEGEDGTRYGLFPDEP